MIVRTPRPDGETFTVLSNAVLRDVRLSWRARGVLAYLLSLPDDWRITAEHLTRCAPEGRDAVRTALTELEHVGYLTRRRRQDSAGRWVTSCCEESQQDRAGYCFSLV